MTADRQYAADRRKSTVELFEKYVLAGPSGDAEGVNVGCALLRRRKLGDLGFKERVLGLLEAARTAFRLRGRQVSVQRLP